MPRLYIVSLLFVCLTFSGLAQKKLKQIIAFADEQYVKGDFYYALEYYKQALEKDSNSIKLLWKYAETLRSYKDYANAENYYAKVYAREQTKTYPNSLLNLALMQKQNGRYTQAIKTLELSAEKLERIKISPFYIKTIREIESCKWALKNSLDSSEFTPLVHLPETVNSYDAEFGHTIKDNRLVFSALKADSSNQQEEVYDQAYRTRLYYSVRDSLGNFQPSKINEDLFHEKLNYGNGSFSIDGHYYYFSICEDDGFSYSCNIVVAEWEDSLFQIRDTLGIEINQNGANSTMPYYTRFRDKEVLVFSSDRKGGIGGMDIWYAESIDGISFMPAINIKGINSSENELTPWYDTISNQLFFSSTWHNGFGGHDIHSSTYIGGVFSSPENAGQPINSPANDLYYFEHRDSSYISSNRMGGFYTKNPTCCSDIYASYPIIELITEESISDTILIEDRLKQMFPITLYFRNDEPDASTYRATTKQTYIETYQKYVDHYDYYKAEVSKGISIDKAQVYVNELDGFFKNKVDFGSSMLDTITSILLKELIAGSRIEVSIKGFASPVANSAYNVNLTKRRISSLINYFKSTDGGAFASYIENETLSFTFIPFGEYAADQTISDDVVVQNESVYSRAAGLERKIQVAHVTIERDKSIFPLMAQNLVQNLENKKSGSVITSTFIVKNKSSEKIEIILPSNTEFQKYNMDKLEVLPNESQKITYLYDTKDLKGHQSLSFEIMVHGYEGSMTLYTNIELE